MDNLYSNIFDSDFEIRDSFEGINTPQLGSFSIFQWSNSNSDFTDDFYQETSQKQGPQPTSINEKKAIFTTHKETNELPQKNKNSIQSKLNAAYVNNCEVSNKFHHPIQCNKCKSEVLQLKRKKAKELLKLKRGKENQEIPLEEELDKLSQNSKEIKKIRNRLSAQKSREKKKVQFAQLVKQNKNLTKQNQLLSESNEYLVQFIRNNTCEKCQKVLNNFSFENNKQNPILKTKVLSGQMTDNLKKNVIGLLFGMVFVVGSLLLNSQFPGKETKNINKTISNGEINIIGGFSINKMSNEPRVVMQNSIPTTIGSTFGNDSIDESQSKSFTRALSSMDNKIFEISKAPKKLPQCPPPKIFDISKNVSYVNEDFNSEMKKVDNNSKEIPFLIEKNELRYKEKYNVPYQNNINTISLTEKAENQNQKYFKIEKKKKGRNLFV